MTREDYYDKLNADLHAQVEGRDDTIRDLQRQLSESQAMLDEGAQWRSRQLWKESYDLLDREFVEVKQQNQLMQSALASIAKNSDENSTRTVAFNTLIKIRDWKVSE